MRKLGKLVCRLIYKEKRLYIYEVVPLAGVLGSKLTVAVTIDMYFSVANRLIATSQA